MRSPARRGGSVVLARSDDGVRFDPVAELDKDRFGAESLERPALVHTGGSWRLYLSCATPGSKHWWICALEAPSLVALADAEPATVFPGDERTGVKDPVIRRWDGAWHAWICCHPLDAAGEEDRMTTAYATSQDGRAWAWRGTVLRGRPGGWDARGARVTAVLPDGRATYDGRATKEENFSERTGLAGPEPPVSERTGVAGPEPPGVGAGAPLVPRGDRPVAAVRYLDVLPLDDGSYRIYFEAPLADGSHELRTELVAAP